MLKNSKFLICLMRFCLNWLQKCFTDLDSLIESQFQRVGPFMVGKRFPVISQVQIIDMAC